jgi:sulfur carrier protein ThiS adenylyltransferase
MLDDNMFKQYLRQISLPNVGEQGQLNICDSRVLIVGCGGLGTAAASYLAGAGVGVMVIADNDIIERSNLPRQVSYKSLDVGNSKVSVLAKSLQAQNEFIRIRLINKRLSGPQLSLEISLADIVVDCSDNLKTRQLINKFCYQHHVSLVSASSIGWKGQLAVFPFSNDDQGPCYRCLYPFDEMKSETNCSESSVMGPVVGIMGIHQALETLKLLIGLAERQQRELKLFDGLKGAWQSLKITKDDCCLVCGPANDCKGEI